MIRIKVYLLQSFCCCFYDLTLYLRIFLFKEFSGKLLIGAADLSLIDLFHTKWDINVFRWMGVGPRVLRAWMWSAEPYPLLEAKP